MERLLLNIANLLYINIQHATDNSLLNGKMGLILFFYEYGRYTGKQMYTDTADTMLDEIVESLSLNCNEVIAGIGWGIQYLIKNEFVEGDPNEILSDIDDRILQMIEFQQGVVNNDYLEILAKSNYNIFVDSYILSRVNSDIRSVKNLELIMDFYQNMLVKAHKPLSVTFLNTCNAFLSCAYSFNNEIENNANIMELLKDCYNQSFAGNFFNAGDLAFANRVNSKSLMELPITYENKYNLDTMESYIHYFIPELLYYDETYYFPDVSFVKRYLNDVISNTSYDNLSLNGIAGIGMLIMKMNQSVVFLDQKL